jgi:hypothetical protein
MNKRVVHIRRIKRTFLPTPIVIKDSNIRIEEEEIQTLATPTKETRPTSRQTLISGSQEPTAEKIDNIVTIRTIEGKAVKLLLIKSIRTTETEDQDTPEIEMVKLSTILKNTELKNTISVNFEKSMS